MPGITIGLITGSVMVCAAYFLTGLLLTEKMTPAWYIEELQKKL